MSSKTRATVQTASITFFLLLILFALDVHVWGLAPDLFLRLDPLAGIAASLSSRSVTMRILWALPILLVTVLLGRVFCGWVCPLGAILDLIGWARRRVGLALPSSAAPKKQSLRYIKYSILVFLGGAAIVGMNLSWFLDPIPLLSRAFTTGLVARTSAAIAMAWAMLIVIILLELLGRRFWCRALCPLGALLGIASACTPLRRRIGETCNECKVCEQTCPVGMELGDYHPAECLQCRRCAHACPQDAISFRQRDHSAYRTPHSAIVSRRSLFASVGVGLAGGIGLRFLGKDVPPPIRPPGAQDEARLAAACARCGGCIRICPTGGLRPVLFEAGPLSLMTPKLVSRIGPCEYGCVACGNACPTGAIRAMPPEQKAKVQIGHAGLNRETCMPNAKGVRCLVCNDACPYEAIEMRATEGVPKPFVLEPLCVGCGICENVCPVEGESAIIVFSTH